jgi:D-alanyl-D-alanine carboxypeptidase/D-alanyl-D-alanine-endopeptidase (penicillin-binding protein 4)
MKFQNSSKPRFIFYILYFTFLISSCGVTKQISRSAQQSVINDSSLLNAHIGISIYEPASSKYWYNYNGEKYFVPASNTKIPTCYAAMKYLGDSLVGLRYGLIQEEAYDKGLIAIQPTGDPTFLHADFKYQPVFSFLQSQLQSKRAELCFMDTVWKDERWGSGWSWNDYEEPYMAERSSFPIYGNTINIKLHDIKDRILEERTVLLSGRIQLFKTGSKYFDSILNKIPRIQVYSHNEVKSPKFKVELQRSMDGNDFSVKTLQTNLIEQNITFDTKWSTTAFNILSSEFKVDWGFLGRVKNNEYWHDCDTKHDIPDIFHINEWKTIHSQPTDSLLKPMMHRSDNFFAEQSLLMVSNEMLGVMNDVKIIDTLLKTDFKDLPQKPRWVDGSGLSRYNLFTPQDFVAILGKMKTEFGMNRIKEIFATGGGGTISSYYKTDSGFIYAKTGTLSGVVALSGFLTTKKGKQLLFSVLVNNHNGSATAVRRAVEKFIQSIRNNY